MTAVVQEARTREVLTGFGRTGRSESDVIRPADTSRLQELIASAPRAGLLARGAGLSYGDAAQNRDGIVVSSVGGPGVRLDTRRQTVTAAASTTLAEILDSVVPAGFILPVLPGTGGVTLGGAIAADVHGKNHAQAGSFSAWTEQIDLVDGGGDLRTLTTATDPDGLRGTVGGMGLTGVILSATIRLRPIETGMLSVTSRRTSSLDATLNLLETAAAQYSAAWIDATASGASLGRGIVELADHAGQSEMPAADGKLRYRQRTARQLPALPVSLVTRLSAQAVNSLWFRRAPAQRTGLTDLASFFHRLDAVAGWNSLTGPDGLIQYQFVVPPGAEKVLAAVLETVQRNGCAPFLGRLTRFGAAAGGPVSFPVAGWCLAIDMPAGHPGLGPLLTGLDMQVADAGGRVCLATDARLGRYAFNAMYGQVTQWRDTRARLDPRGLFQSDLGRRVGLC